MDVNINVGKPNDIVDDDYADGWMVNHSFIGDCDHNRKEYDLIKVFAMTFRATKCAEVNLSVMGLIICYGGQRWGGLVIKSSRDFNFVA